MLGSVRRMGVAVAAGLFLAVAAAPASADELANLAAKAAGKGPVTWYESSPEDQSSKIISAFNKRFPKVEVKHVRVVGGNTLASRAVQEMQARGHTADVLTGGADHIWQLNERGYILSRDWTALGVPKQVVPSDFAVATASAIYVVLWNSNKVKDDEAPKTWKDITDPRWTGRIGSWVRANAFAMLASSWGEDRAKAELEKFVKLKPFLFKSTFTLAQGVASGEVDVAVGLYHTAQPPIKAGAPVKVRVLDPTPMDTIYSAVSKTARNAEGAQLFVAWLATPEGSAAYEEATSRGNPELETTKTFAMLKGKKVAEYPPSKSIDLGRVNEDFNKILATAGQAR